MKWESIVLGAAACGASAHTKDPSAHTKEEITRKVEVPNLTSIPRSLKVGECSPSLWKRVV